MNTSKFLAFITFTPKINFYIIKTLLPVIEEYIGLCIKLREEIQIDVYVWFNYLSTMAYIHFDKSLKIIPYDESFEVNE